MHARLRDARIADLLPDEALGGRQVRRIDATAVVVPGAGRLDGYVAGLGKAVDTFAAWDGRVLVLPPDDEPLHRVVLVDRYGQVYAIFEGAPDELPEASVLEEWFRSLATACPECGVIDDPVGHGWVP